MANTFKRKPVHAFGSVVCSARIAYGLTQEELAGLIQVSTRWLQKIEAGEGMPNLQHIIHLMAILDIDPHVVAQEVGLVVPVLSH